MLICSFSFTFSLFYFASGISFKVMLSSANWPCTAFAFYQRHHILYNILSFIWFFSKRGAVISSTENGFTPCFYFTPFISFDTTWQLIFTKYRLFTSTIVLGTNAKCKDFSQSWIELCMLSCFLNWVTDISRLMKAQRLSDDAEQTSTPCNWPVQM